MHVEVMYVLGQMLKDGAGGPEAEKVLEEGHGVVSLCCSVTRDPTQRR